MTRRGNDEVFIFKKIEKENKTISLAVLPPSKSVLKFHVINANT